jgi:hypothetical protein
MGFDSVLWPWVGPKNALKQSTQTLVNPAVRPSIVKDFKGWWPRSAWDEQA